MRKATVLKDGWRFLKRDMDFESAAKYAGSGESVSLPHTWNAEDGQDGGNDYYRGACWYVRPLGDVLNAACGEGLCTFLEVNGAAMTSDVYLDGERIAHHEGGYSAFRADITGRIRENSILAIRVDNSDNSTVYPQKADFTFYGGLYREVRLITVPEEHFGLMTDGSLGVRITPSVDLSAKSAVVAVEADHNAERFFAQINGETKSGKDRVEFTIPDVHLWDGLDDPYLYTAKLWLQSGDELTVRFGCRSFGFDPQKGFFLNGRSYPLRGVSRHQDLKGKGNALSIEDHRADMEIIKELGANTLRLAHYQQAQEFYDLCDENGIVVWAEIPYISMHMQAGRQNTLDQMRELIAQCYNHPCIAVWGLSNEITAASAVNEDLLENHRALNELCHRMDPSRKTTMADVFMLETDSPILDIPDVNSYNLYYGWYVGEMEQTDEFFDEFHAEYPDKVMGFSEYGADANPAFHSPDPEKGDYTEEFQALYHEHMLKMIEERPWLWATHVWNLFDFAADGRDEGGKHGENQKGLVTFDRKIKKDAFYLYKAAWNKSEPFAHLCGSRYIDRCESETEVKVYSNQSRVILYVDGKEFEAKDGRTIFRFRVPVTAEHRIEAFAEGCADRMIVRKVSEPNESYIFNKAAASVANWFDSSEIDTSCFSVQDTLGELKAHPQAGAVVTAMMDKAASSRGDVADAVKDNPVLQKMLAKMSLLSLLKQGGADEESIKQLNRVLQGIKK